jgi:hypothetical protein
MSRLVAMMGLLLGASLGLNAWLLLGAGHGRRPSGGAGQGATTAGSRDGPGEETAGDRQRERDELARCRREAFGLVARLDARGPEGSRAGDPPAAARPAVDAGGATDGGVGVERRRAMLCEIAREQLKEHWENRRTQVMDFMRESLGRPGGTQEDLNRDLDRMTAVLELSPADRQRLEEEHGPQYRARMDAARAALGADPPDARALYEAAQGLMADEEAVVARYAGADGLEKWRVDRLRFRTAALGILSTYAGVSWDEALGL